MRRATRGDLVAFGVVLPLTCALAGSVVSRGAGLHAARAIWALGGALSVAYWSVRALRRPIHAAWMGLVEPLGHALSHALMALVFFGIVTPLGLVMRLLGRDPLARRLRRGPGSYWVRHDPSGDPGRYLRQS